MGTAKITAPNEGYNGKTLGVRFTDGEALVNDVTVPKALGRSPEQVIKEFQQDYPEYHVEAASGAVFAVPEMPWKKAPEEAAEEKKGRR